MSDPEDHERRAAKGDVHAVARLAILAEMDGDPEAARVWYVNAAERGATYAPYCLTLLAQDAGDDAATTAFWGQETSRVNAWAAGRELYALGCEAEGVGELPIALAWFTNGARLGDMACMNGLSSVAAALADYDLAIRWAKVATGEGDEFAFERLEGDARRRDDLEGGRALFERAANEGIDEAMVRLAGIEESLGHFKAARSWYEKAASDDGRVHELAEFDKRRADAGESRAMASLGVAAEEGGKIDEAREWFQKAAAEGDARGLVNLGRLAELDGDEVAARSLYEQAAERGDRDAILALRFLTGDVTESDMDGELDEDLFGRDS